MLIAPPQQQESQKKHHFNLKITHWSLMVFFWLIIVPCAYCIISIRSGHFFTTPNSVMASALFALSLLISIYSVGMTLFFIANLFLNKLHDKKYKFFAQLNAVALSVFAVLFMFALITF